MQLVVQTVLEASCTVDEKVISKIDNGYMVLVGIGTEDDEKICEKMALKLSKLRVFEDEVGKMNLDIHTTKGEILSISQFTLYADTSSGNRPSFTKAQKGDRAKELYDYFNKCLENQGIIVKTGVFGAHMKISLINDGPKTFILRG